jgi:hypothetical protein
MVVVVGGGGRAPVGFFVLEISTKVLCLRILLLASCWGFGLPALLGFVDFGIMTSDVAE